MTTPRPGRKPGSRNRRPSKREVQTYMDLLRDRAQAGDVHAAGWLVSLHHAEQLALQLNTED